MRVVRDLDSWRELRDAWDGVSVGFVPTMGALHEGHGSLVRTCVADNDRTVVSIYVNPTQFDQPEDLEAYPRDLDGDFDRLRDLGVDVVLLPHYEMLYPDAYRYRVTENVLARRLCGAHRRGHFDGVLTVVLRLLNLIGPDRAYFGEKDWQQLQLVRGMVEAFFLPVEIVACATVRESDGLALSSRNRRLDPASRNLAPEFPRALRNAASAAKARRSLEHAGFEVDYVEDLEGRRLGAVRLGGVRLIDNVPLAEWANGQEKNR